MTNQTDGHFDTTGVETATADDAGSPTRRRVLRGSLVAASALGLGLGAIGTAAAKGKGGEAAVPVEDYLPEKGAFSFVEPTGNIVKKTCEKGGNGIRLAEWTFRYAGEEELRSIYTRDNAIDTSRRYRFSGEGAVDCGGFFLTPFSPANDR